MTLSALLATEGPLLPRALMRGPEEVMRPERLAAIQPSRVSASRNLIARASRQRWTITQKAFDIDEKGRGHARYAIEAGSWRFSFPIFSFEPSSRERTGRIIGRAWDMMGALVEGDMSPAAVSALQGELPKLYEGRATPNTLTWARSNRSGRLFDLAVNALAKGEQPPVEALGGTCYLMRNTGIDGNGTFGTKSFLAFEKDHPLRASLQAQMLTAYMMRVFALDLVQHFARLQGGTKAAGFAPDLARFLGVGNGSALGLMFFVNNHPRLINQWLTIRETAIAHGKLVPVGRDAAPLRTLASLLEKAIVARQQDRSEYESFTPSLRIAEDLVVIRRELDALIALAQAGETGATPLLDFTASLDGRVHAEAFETLLSLLIELVPDVADSLSDTLVIDEELTGRPEMRLGRLREIVRSDYRWAFDLDLTSERSQRYVWYKSRTAEEPRRGPREEIGEAHNLGLDLPRLIVALDRDLSQADPKTCVARFLLQHPEHRLIATRVQALAGLPYHSPHADIMSEDFVPAQITRLLNVGIHGIDKARDFLNRNLRGVIFHGAPTPADLAAGTADPHWFYPPEPRS
ncbi:hypothetical protein IED13_01995 [Bosea sp. SSUT16]|jgi:uncharacterized tellurite resistance protein B-like protein|uniref:Uncharacterized protein n=1 Tax=Bosea spartocytisi TaxID=2773451 RepID=A0A927E6C7_9HYPH|nr:hypothetical protein [Bosea spartocytisi]MBD3844455.1 hypothetical protein [Bosea spartocytisi]MCT4470439.1 hypothetical protein [Bosea spartocytisi]